MAWERGYYYRVRKEGGRVIREYFGKGKPAELMAQIDALNRANRQAEREARRAENAELDALDSRVKELDEMADLLAHAALLAAGYRQHKRGEWRRKRRAREGPSPSG